MTTTREAWRNEINILKQVLAKFIDPDGQIIFEYDIPRLGKRVDANWVISPYAPTPTIIEAARSLYENHTVEDITRHEADNVSTDRTIACI